MWIVITPLLKQIKEHHYNPQNQNLQQKHKNINLSKLKKKGNSYIKYGGSKIIQSCWMY